MGGIITHLTIRLFFNVFISIFVVFKGEDGFDRSKGRSKECGYCGKSFRSSYYLTVHLRTHTGIVTTSGSWDLFKIEK